MGGGGEGAGSVVENTNLGKRLVPVRSEYLVEMID